MTHELQQSYITSNVLESGYSLFRGNKLVSINFFPITQKCYVHIRNRKAEKSVTLSLEEFQLLIDMKNSIVEIRKELISVVSLIIFYVDSIINITDPLSLLFIFIRNSNM